METTTADRIEKEIVLKATRSRVWKAISDPAEFGTWFKVDMSGVKFEPGKPVNAKMTYPGYEGMPLRDGDRPDPAGAPVQLSLAPVRHRPELRLLERTDDAYRVRAGGGAGGHEADGDRVWVRRDPLGTPRRG